ncbi:hypothetical protein C8R46DRAFT_1025288 [Mycena filopes]|nr:hypothetical protein C8R46DRAFT_1025288 [Mycena filopes]
MPPKNGSKPPKSRSKSTGTAPRRSSRTSKPPRRRDDDGYGTGASTAQRTVSTPENSPPPSPVLAQTDDVDIVDAPAVHGGAGTEGYTGGTLPFAPSQRNFVIDPAPLPVIDPTDPAAALIQQLLALLPAGPLDAAAHMAAETAEQEALATSEAHTIMESAVYAFQAEADTAVEVDVPAELQPCQKVQTDL